MEIHKTSLLAKHYLNDSLQINISRCYLKCNWNIHVNKISAYIYHANMSCDIKNVVYVMKCRGCGEEYIGETAQQAPDVCLTSDIGYILVATSYNQFPTSIRRHFLTSFGRLDWTLF